MTIAETSNSIKSVISQHKVYGAEVIINSLVYACKDEPYLTRDAIIHLLDSAYERIEK